MVLVFVDNLLLCDAWLTTIREEKDSTGRNPAREKIENKMLAFD
jgi:hypothetical protein